MTLYPVGENGLNEIERSIAGTLTYQIPEGVREYSYHGEETLRCPVVDPPLHRTRVWPRVVSCYTPP